MTYHAEFIGNKPIVGVNSEVASHIPPCTIAAGNHCHVLRSRFDWALPDDLLKT